MIWEQLKKLIVGFVLGTIFGAYAITHIPETWNGYQGLRGYVIRLIHHEPTCPQNWTCKENVEPAASPTNL